MVERATLPYDKEGKLPKLDAKRERVPFWEENYRKDDFALAIPMLLTLISASATNGVQHDIAEPDAPKQRDSRPVQYHASLAVQGCMNDFPAPYGFSLSFR